MLKILGRATSINVQKVMWCAAELGIEVDRVDIGGPHGGNDTPEYLGKNPNGLVPTLEDDDFVLWESNSIVRYLAETRGQAHWFPAEATGRALVSQWMDWYLTRLHPPMTVIFWGQVRTAPEDRDHEAEAEAAGQAGAASARLLVPPGHGGQALVHEQRDHGVVGLDPDAPDGQLDAVGGAGVGRRLEAGEQLAEPRVVLVRRGRAGGEQQAQRQSYCD